MSNIGQTAASTSMGNSSNNLANEIKEKMPIELYISRFVELKLGSTGEYSGKCPFHNDTNPSFSVSSKKGLYYCAGCGATGDLFNFSQEINGIPFTEAFKELAKELGLQRDRAPLDPALKMLIAMSYRYQEALPGSDIATKYLATRSIKPETIKRFGIGYCVGNEFDKSGAAGLAQAVEAGILAPAKEDKSRPWNLMTRRLTFTIKNKDGLVVGFGGRKLDTDSNPDKDRKSPKYINTHETAFFKKGDVLFGLHEAKLGIFKNKFAIVVEGYMDTVILHQEGLDNAVAVMGASASDRAFESLWNVTKRIVFCLDGDKAGRDGTLRSIMHAAKLMKDDSKIDIIRLPDGIDPDEYVLMHGADAFRNLCSDAMPLSRFLCDTTLSNEQNINGAFSFRITEDRARYHTMMQAVADSFDSAPLLQNEIMRQANATLSAFVISAALASRDIKALPEEIKLALEMTLSMMPEFCMSAVKQDKPAVSNPVQVLPGLSSNAKSGQTIDSPDVAARKPQITRRGQLFKK